MSAEKRSGIDRRGESREQIDTLVATRTETLTLYTDLAGRRPFTEESTTVRAVQRFCQALIDYTASAHFQLYRHLEEKKERRATVLDIAELALPRIMETTDYILKFNEKYENPSLKEHADELADDLSELGEILADRIQFEDQVIQAVTNDRRNVIKKETA